MALDGTKSQIETSRGAKKYLNRFDTALAMVAATIGGEIIAVPYAVYHMGIWLSLFVLLAVSYISQLSSMMYLKIKDLHPLHSESLYELTYHLLGKWAVYTVCFIQWLLNFASILLYFVIITDTSSHLVATFFVTSEDAKSQD